MRGDIVFPAYRAQVSIPLRFEAQLIRLTTKVSVDTRGANRAAVKLDVELTPAGGVVIGRVTDAETGKGVSGRISYLADKANDALRGAWTVRVRDDIHADIDGDFHFAAPAGSGYVAFIAFDETYRKKESKPEDASEMTDTVVFSGVMSGGPEYHALVKLDIKPGGGEHRVDLQVVRSEVILGEVFDPDGKALSGGFYTGRQELSHVAWQPLVGNLFQVLHFDAKQPRHLFFAHPERNLAGEFVLKEKPSANLSIRLQPAATVTGRLVDEDGAPIRGVTLFSGDIMTPARIPLPPAPETWWSQLNQHETDEEGRFVIKAWLPGRKYHLSGFRDADRLTTRFGTIVQDLTLKPGEERDLGTIDYEDAPAEEILKRRREVEKEKGVIEAKQGSR